MRRNQEVPGRRKTSTTWSIEKGRTINDRGGMDLGKSERREEKGEKKSKSEGKGEGPFKRGENKVK